MDRAVVEPVGQLRRSTLALQFRIPHSAFRIKVGAGPCGWYCSAFPERKYAWRGG
jgi:hypothetical protein